ncbi:transglutaminase domain-containing protein [Roseovarius indicus]|uniref:Transglutaminase-like superfamily protein n=1 Tax=Roseovarius indicus TaxID=540747 RepID=A0A5P3AJ48_9RHOB|nr:transglutaminase domain-containing protein [Roseovarius indicus]QEW28806.1 Transglutaminase-like superfamily protein [Roseovarius indicus]SFD84086.1 Transglutaminase-like superfamily protein [Roseovarius indicus]
MAADVFDPGERGGLLDGLEPSPGAFCAALHGVLIHDHFGAICYPAVPPDFATASRETLPAAARLARIDEYGEGFQPRPPERRTVGTCRDFAVMFCAMARRHGMEAQVRCGFADYLDPPGFEDHWICEYRAAGGGRWAQADPQLDAAHIAHLNIGFDPTDLPDGAFLTGCEAWRAVRRGTAMATDFGHGDACGAWFLKVNLLRDLHCLLGQVMSDWDQWRQVADSAVHDAVPDALCDRLAEAGTGGASSAVDLPAPPIGGAAM